MDIICKKIGIPNNDEYSLTSTKDATHEEQMNKKMETLKAKLHTEDEGNYCKEQEKNIKLFYSKLAGRTQNFERARCNGSRTSDNETQVLLYRC